MIKKFSLTNSLIKDRKDSLYVLKIIENRDQFIKLFSLRYFVWNKLGYISCLSKCPLSKLEVDLADRSATTIGIFTKETANLVACGRLVEPFGKENPIILPKN